MSHDDYRDVPLTLAVTLALWSGTVAAATNTQVFLRVPTEAYLALAAFASLFAALVVLVDARVRGWLVARGALAGGTAALGLAAMLAAGGIVLAQGGGIAIAAAPWASLLLVGVPVTLASGLAAALSAWRAGASRLGCAATAAGD